MSNTFGKILKQLRESNNMTQGHLGDLVNTTRQSISNYEIGKRKPDYVTLEAFADIFNVDIDYLLGKTNKTTILPNNSHRPLSKEEKDLLKNYNNSSTQGKKIILDTSKNISKAYPYISREEMIDYLEEFQIAAYNGAKNLHSLSYEELEEKYYRLKEDFGDDK